MYPQIMNESDMHQPQYRNESDMSDMLELPNACIHLKHRRRRSRSWRSRKSVLIMSNMNKKWTKWTSVKLVKNDTKEPYTAGTTLLVAWELNPWHCMVDHLFSLEAYLATTNNVQYVVVGQEVDWCSKVVPFFVDGFRIPFHDKQCFEKLLVPDYTKHRWLFQTPHIHHNWFLKKARSHPCSVPQDPNLAILYPRFDTHKRRWHNIEEIAHFLRSITTLNVTVVKHLGTKKNNNICSQVQLFSSAKILLYPHGAHMANFIWTHPQTHEITFFCSAEQDYNRNWVPSAYSHFLPAKIDPKSKSGKCSVMSPRYLTIRTKHVSELFCRNDLLRPFLARSAIKTVSRLQMYSNNNSPNECWVASSSPGRVP